MFGDMLKKFQSGAISSSSKQNQGYVKGASCPLGGGGGTAGFGKGGQKGGGASCGNGSQSSYGGGTRSNGYDSRNGWYIDSRYNKVSIGDTLGVKGRRPNTDLSKDKVSNNLDKLQSVKKDITDWTYKDVQQSTGLQPGIIHIPGLHPGNIGDSTLSGKTGQEVADDLYNKGFIDDEGRRDLIDSGMSGGQIEEIINGSISRETAGNIKDSDLWYELDETTKNQIDRVISTGGSTTIIKISITNIINIIVINRGYDFLLKNFVTNIDITNKFPDLGRLDEYYKQLDKIRDEYFKLKDLISSLQDIIRDLSNLKDKIVNDRNNLEDLINSLINMKDKNTSNSGNSTGNNGAGGNSAGSDNQFGNRYDPSQGVTDSGSIQDLISTGNISSNGGNNDNNQDWTGTGNNGTGGSNAGGNNSGNGNDGGNGDGSTTGGGTGKGVGENQDSTGSLNRPTLPDGLDTGNNGNGNAGSGSGATDGSGTGWWEGGIVSTLPDTGSVGITPEINDENQRPNNNRDPGWENAGSREEAVDNTINREVENNRGGDLSNSDRDRIAENAEAGFDINRDYDTAENKKNICPEKGFVLEHYVTRSLRHPDPLICDKKVENLRTLYSTILRPVAIHYADQQDGIQCCLNILCGLCSQSYAVSALSGHALSRHIYGEAVDFYITGVTARQVFDDIRSKKINLTYGVLSLNTSYIHVTLPYTFKGKHIQGLTVQGDPRGTSVFDLIYDW